ncbi:MAG: UDP-N-acetylmuramate--L-alanine ligase [Candidatus Hinthialibacter sp.]
MQQDESLQGFRHIHLIGAGGIGVSALAQVLHARGYKVTGSDPARSVVTERLEQMGITIFHEHRAENIAGASLLVATSAAQDDNPEIQAARRQNIPIWKRAQMLGHLVNDSRAIVVTGAHGKTTITAMLTRLFLDTGLDPTAFIGGDVASLGGNAVSGRGEWAIAEGDESDGSFVYLKPEIAIVNNIDADHLDFYENIDAIIEQFNVFLQGIRENGWLLRSADCALCDKLRPRSDCRVQTYGFSPSADVRGLDCRSGKDSTFCQVEINGRSIGELRLVIPGKHHLHNALAVVAAAAIVGLPFPQVRESLARFEGVKRRMEYKGSARGVVVLDDYAHHPTEIQSTIQGLRDRYNQRIIGVFQPHLYSRTLKLLNEFGQAFIGLDQLILTDIYPAREKPVPDVTGEVLLKPVQQSGVNAVYVHSLQNVPDVLASQLQPGDIVVTLGAGDVWKIGERLLERLLEEKESSIP